MRLRAKYFSRQTKAIRGSAIFFPSSSMAAACSASPTMKGCSRRIFRRRQTLSADLCKPDRFKTDFSMYGRCRLRLVWQAHNDIAEYGLRHATVSGVQGLGRNYALRPYSASARSAGKRQDPADRQHLWRSGRANGFEGIAQSFDEILAREGFAVFAVDNRGTPGRDRKFKPPSATNSAPSN